MTIQIFVKEKIILYRMSYGDNASFVLDISLWIVPL